VTQLSNMNILVDPDALGGNGRGIMFGAVVGLTPAAIMLMASRARGVIAAALSVERAFALDIAPMPGGSCRTYRPITLVSVEAHACTETGISAQERCTTLRALGAWDASPADFRAPGHVIVTVVPSRLAVAGQPAVLSEIAYRHAARNEGALAIAWTDVLDDRGSIASVSYCRALAAECGLPCLELRDGATIRAAIASAA